MPSTSLYKVQNIFSNTVLGNIRIDNSSSLETQAWEQELNPEPGFLWAARPVDRRTAHPRFPGIEPP
ncbi:hypothetical protein DSO57_1000612 [Entomophthora muscae]|uniref:Uncharacterized protein n=1 Tax=Entomophthora muscae TaxID=34485 RepID=A0ACC2S0D2_9FUNG|nr:hypothetical protein DSO57_1000612 [Entomophthora muscae]